MIFWPRVQAVPGSQGKMFRREPFGATIAFRRPESLVMVDHRFARWLGAKPSDRPTQQQPGDGLVPGAPFEAHLTIDHSCSCACKGCYIGARDDSEPTMDKDEWRAVLERLAQLGVYHLALGGGEGTSWELLLELAHRARALGMTPNLTTAGTRLTPRLARKLTVFERVHVSLDGVGPIHSLMRGHDGYSQALMALRILCAYHPRVGVNCVVGGPNADHLGPLFKLLSGLGISEVELLRYKPAGRALDNFSEMNLRADQAATVVPRVLGLALRHRVRVRLDCSFTPMVCASGIAPSTLGRLGLAGCVAGSWLVSIGPDGGLSGCSFDEQVRAHWTDLGRPEPMTPYTTWTAQAREPCASCRWLGICRGGCHVVSQRVCSDFNAPDPGCPLVAESCGE